MYYLGLDTTNKYIIVSLFNDIDVLYFKKEIANRNASELISVMIKESLDKEGIKPSDLTAIVVTRGPGSFTGVRIGLSAAKVLAMALNIKLYSLSSMQYISGVSSIPVIFDARSRKVYLGKYDQGKIISEELVPLDQINTDLEYLGDTDLIDRVSVPSDLSNNFILLKNLWKEESYFDAVPSYLKSNLW